MSLLALTASQLPAQTDDILITHKNYTTIFSRSYRYPVQVEWWITRDKIECKNPAPRRDRFLPDPQVLQDSDLETDYKGSGFDRGHLSPAADSRCVTGAMEESFYYTNMAPQYPGLNRGQWKALEDNTRDLAKQYDSVHVVAGCVGVAKRVHRIAIPTHCWKLIEVSFPRQTRAYVFPNLPERTASYQLHEVSLDSLRSLRRIP